MRRRYRDFVLLQEALRDSHPGIILSPLPPATIHGTLFINYPIANNIKYFQQETLSRGVWCCYKDTLIIY